MSKDRREPFWERRQREVYYVLGELLHSDKELYDKITETTGFSYFFNVLCHMAQKPLWTLDAIQAKIAGLPPPEPSKDTLASLQQRIDRLSLAVRNQCADNQCWIEFTDKAGALPRDEFLKSCERYHAQLQNTVDLEAGTMTIAQLEAENEELRLQVAKLREFKRGVELLLARYEE